MKLISGTVLKGAKYDYVIKEVLGQGTFGITYLASVRLSADLGSIESNAQVAIKEFFMQDVNGRAGTVVTSGGKGTLFDKYRNKFAKEAENLSKLKHPNIVRVLECFEANNTVYYAMEYVTGGSLDRLIAKRKGLKMKDCMPILSQIGSALSYMHDNKMLHLDLKPANVVMTDAGKPVLIDFGLSKQYDDDGKPESTTSIGGGTPGYAPVEQLNYHDGRGFPVTMDVYALGATLYKMLTGIRPADASDVLNEGLDTGALRLAGVSDEEVDCITRALAPLKKDRWESVSDFLDALGCPMEAASDEYSDCDESEDTVIDDVNVRPDKERIRSERKGSGLNGKKSLQTICKIIFAISAGVILYSGYVAFEFTYRYYNQSYPHSLLMWSVFLLTLLGTASVWVWKMSFKRSVLVKTLLSLLLLCCGLCSSYFFAVDYEYTEFVSENVYRERSVLVSDGDMLTVQNDVIPFYKGRKAGLMNGRTGKIILPAEYTDAESASSSIWLFELAETRKYSFSDDWSSGFAEYDKQGNTIIALGRDGKSGVMNIKGEVVVPLIYDYWDEIHGDSEWESLKGNVIVGKDGMFGIISKQNDEILPLQYSEIRSSFYAQPYPYIILAKDGLWGAIDVNTRKVVIPFEYEDINLSASFGKNRLFSYKENGRWGMRTSRYPILDCEYGEIYGSDMDSYYDNGHRYMSVTKNGKYGVIDIHGSGASSEEMTVLEVIPFEYDRTFVYSNTYDLQLFIVEKDGKKGVVNVNNEVVVPLEWDMVYMGSTDITAQDYDKEWTVKFNHYGERIN